MFWCPFFPNISLISGKSLFVEHHILPFPWIRMTKRRHKKFHLWYCAGLSDGFKSRCSVPIWGRNWAGSIMSKSFSFYFVQLFANNLPRVDLGFWFTSSFQLCLDVGTRLTALGSLPLHSSFSGSKFELERRNNIFVSVVFPCLLVG